MKVVILYRPKSEHSRQVEEYVHDFVKQQSTRRVEAINVDSREGTALAKLYDIVQYPAFLALQNDGQFLKSWIAEYPLMNELAYYARPD